MVFKRRKPLGYAESAVRFFYPRGGWRRAAQYVVHRLRRLPDPAHKIARGFAAGVVTSFTPFFGFHFVIAAVLAWALRGNMMAGLLGTFVGNPLTFPFIAAVSMETGTWILGRPSVPLPFVFTSFSQASLELWRNFLAIFGPETTHWASLAVFFDRIFLPYLVGGILPGIACAIAAYVLTEPVLAAYQKARVARLKKRFAKKRERAEARRLSQGIAIRSRSRQAAE